MKIMLCNVGWSDNYNGSFLKGDHGFIRKHKGDGSERWNFKRFPDGKVYGYIRGMGGEKHSPPQLPANLQRAWTVLFYAKDPQDRVLKFVGFYRGATVSSHWENHPINKAIQGESEKHVYCATTSADKAVLFPEDRRPVVGQSFGQAGFVYLTDPRTSKVARKNARLYKQILEYMKGHIPDSPDGNGSNPSSPTTIDQEHREAVERASMSVVKQQLRKEGFLVRDISQDKIGYDLHAERGADILYVEVKGTGGPEPRFIITKNEISFMGKDPSSRIAIVTNALTQPKLHVLKGFNLDQAFNLRPLQLEATPRANSSCMITGVKKFFCLP